MRPVAPWIQGQQPFFGQNVVASNDLHEAITLIGSRLKAHRLSIAGGRQEIDTRMNEVRLGGVSLFYLRYGAEVVVDPGPFEDFHILHVNVGGECEVISEQRSVRVGASHARFCPPDEALRFRWRPDSEVVGIKFRCDALHQTFQDLTGLPLQGAIRLEEDLDLNSYAGQRIINLLRFIDMDAALPDGLWRSPTGAAQLERLVLSTILLSQAGSHHSLVTPPVSPAAPHYVRKAEMYMHNHRQQALRLEDIAAHVGVSSRSLNSGFRQFRGVSPMAYFNNLRLEGARSDILAERRGVTIAEIAQRWGFHHLGAFAHSYRRRFGVSPAESRRTFS